MVPMTRTGNLLHSGEFLGFTIEAYAYAPDACAAFVLDSDSGEAIHAWTDLTPAHAAVRGVAWISQNLAR